MNDANTLLIMQGVLKNKNKEIQDLKQAVRELAENIIWCGGSNDFSLGGIARKGWEKGPMKTLNNPTVKRVIREGSDDSNS